ncbi:MAG: type II toxin-antitoxin system PemK/MazF family toxin [Saprospiraceae bacterium]|nr:type II toxin-antitoxin system PemK/MazF family toxin [Saprospiraceae bacterium]
MNGDRRKINRFEIWYVSLDPTVGSEISKSRPCLVISQPEMNNNLKTVLVAPITHKIKNYPSRISFQLQSQDGQIVLDHIRAVDKLRFVKKIGKLDDVMSYLVYERLKRYLNISRMILICFKLKEL